VTRQNGTSECAPSGQRLSFSLGTRASRIWLSLPVDWEGPGGYRLSGEVPDPRELGECAGIRRHDRPPSRSGGGGDE